MNATPQQRVVLATLNEHVVDMLASLNFLRYYRVNCDEEENVLRSYLAQLSPTAETVPSKTVLQDMTRLLDVLPGWCMVQYTNAIAAIESIGVDPEFAAYLTPTDEVRAAQLAKLSSAMEKRKAWIGGASGGEMSRRS